ncbi:hypothetical protein KUV85_08685 [Nocardioides panacisoli]|uniref:SCO7613 C-terminal domain-containing membrane protein n=1 Tax=Nocardioides panacisoli TaxID=627624 RepID=UPI001C6263A6|nr:hypothetical protein [Nocardioides panacisoli]QYJ05739.1 hypothetical protein KUV85_08685 [Nocardioides panacisoli]
MVPMTYADPTRCPGCRDHLPAGVDRCPHCDLLVRHALAQQLFATLTRADRLVAQLRTEHAAVPVPAAAAAAPPPPPVVPGMAPAAVAPAPGRPGLMSVPRVLLGLGALCLLVAAVIFLAVTWSWLGVGGRTVVLVGLTAGAAGLATVLLRHGLRIAAESLATVSLGLLALDVAGAESAGWLGDLPAGGPAVATGLVVAAAGVAIAIATRPPLVAPQVAAALGALVAYAGAADLSDHPLLVGHATLVVLATAWLAARRLELAVLAGSVALAGVVVWSITTVVALGTGLADPTLRGFWVVEGAGWSLLVSGVALLAPGLLLHRVPWLVAGGAGAVLLATIAATAPAIDASARTLAVVAVATTAAWVAATAVVPARARAIGVLPAAVGALLLAGLLVVTTTVAAWRWASLGGPFGVGAEARIGGPDPVTEPLVAAPAAALILGILVAGRIVRGPVSGWLPAAGLVSGVAGLATLASYPVPLAVLVAGAGVLTAASLVLGVRATTDRGRTGHGLAAFLLAATTCGLALPSAALTAAAALATLCLAVALHLLGPTPTVRVAGGIAGVPAAGLAVVAIAGWGAIDPSRVGVPLLLVLGLLALARPRPEVEVPAAFLALPATAYAVPAAGDVGGSLALHLAVAGALMTATGLLHRERRPAVAVGGVLLVLASWVRLGDLGVSAPEPYTLPLALALTGAGLWRLHRDPACGTPTALVPGLSLATVPTLLWVLDDPVSLRALLLGAACVGLAVGGAALRWSAPLGVGAIVGTVLVVRELAPYAGSAPQWLWIGLAGTLLTVVGVTWERRLQEVRAAAGRLGQLR